MILNKVFRVASVSTAMLAGTVMAEGHQHEAHVHGIAELNFVIEGNVAEMELRSPLMNIAGFEHEAVSAEDKQKIKLATTQLKDAYARVKLPDAALCIIDDVDVVIGNSDEESHNHHGHDDHKDRHGHDDHHAHKDHHGHEDHHGHDKHDDHKDHHGHDEHHAHKDHHGHEDHHDHEEHSEAGHRDIVANYSFQCVNPEKIDAVTLDFFSHFPHMETVKVNVLNGADIRAVELTPKQRVLEL